MLCHTHSEAMNVFYIFCTFIYIYTHVFFCVYIYPVSVDIVWVSLLFHAVPEASYGFC